MSVYLRQRNVRVRVRELVESAGEWGSTSKSWEAQNQGTIQKVISLTTIGGDRSLQRLGAEYDADWFALARHKPEIKQGWLLESLDGNDNVINKFIVQKTLSRGPFVGILLRENPNIQS